MEKKKRFRPTVTAYRELEEELAETKQRLSNHLSANVRYAEDIAKFTSKVSALENSNRLMEEELEGVRKDKRDLIERCKELINERQELKSRGFWARVFNL